VVSPRRRRRRRRTGDGGPTHRENGYLAEPAERARSEGLVHLRAAESFLAEIG
jgi:hypothetical protein